MIPSPYLARTAKFEPKFASSKDLRSGKDRRRSKINQEKLMVLIERQRRIMSNACKRGSLQNNTELVNIID